MEEIVKEQSSSMIMTTYVDFKNTLADELNKQTEGFVRIGYLLKVARDTNILAESRYSSVAEFAKVEYGLTKDVVSRYISINDKFSEGGYSDQLDSRYKSFGYSKLATMLTMPIEVIDAIPEQATKAEIQTISAEIREENKISSLELLAEREPIELQNMDCDLHKAIYLILKEDPEKYVTLLEMVRDASPEEETQRQAAYDALAPSEYMVETVRIPSMGKFMVTIKNLSQPISMVNVRDGIVEEYTWQKLLEGVYLLCPPVNDAKAAWEIIYKEDYPKNVEVAPVQPEPVKTVQKPDKPLSMTEKALLKDKKTDKAPDPDSTQMKDPVSRTVEHKDHDMNPPEEEPEQQLEGQMNVEDYPEIMPEGQQGDTDEEIQEEPEEIDEKGRLEDEKVEKHEQIHKLVSRMLVAAVNRNYADIQDMVKQMDILLQHMQTLEDRLGT